MKRLVQAAVVAVACGSAGLPVAQAGPIPQGTFAYTTTATQSVELFKDTPLNMTGGSIFFDTAASGSLVVTYGPEVGGVVPTSPVADLVGVLPFGYKILAGAQFGVPATAGQISNIVPDPNDPDGLLSADFNEVAYFLLVIDNGPTIYTDQANPAIITAVLTGVPYPVGTVFSSPDPLNLYLQVTPGVFDPNTDILVGQSTNRSFVITAIVPEPASAGLLVVGAVGLAARWGRRKSIG